VIKYIQFVKPEKAEGIVKPVYEQIERDFGRIVEPFLMHSALPELLAGAWMACRETELVGNVPRNIKEAVASAVSMQNQCPYCVDAHGIMLSAGGDKALAKAIRTGDLSKVKDEQTRAIVEWALKGSPAKFTEAEAAEIVGTAVYFHYINRMANVLLTETPFPTKQPLLKRMLTPYANRMFSSAIHQPKTAGDSLEFLPEADLPEDMAWAKPAANVAGAFARFAKVVDIDGEYAVPLKVRVEVKAEIEEFVAEGNEMNQNMVTKLTGQFNDEAFKSAAQLTLMTAFMPHRVDEKVVAKFRRHYPEDTKLLGALAWASFTVARKIGGKLSR
jgi:AhpD family alkylhydroperoxidase